MPVQVRHVRSAHQTAIVTSGVVPRMRPTRGTHPCMLTIANVVWFPGSAWEPRASGLCPETF